MMSSLLKGSKFKTVFLYVCTTSFLSISVKGHLGCFHAIVNSAAMNKYPIEYYSAIKENEIMPFAATWMDLEIIILSEVCQTEKDKYHMISLIGRI